MHAHGFAAFVSAFQNGAVWHWFFARSADRLLSAAAIGNYLKLALGLIPTFLLEVAYRKNWRVRYGSKDFRVDMLYYVFYYGGFYHVFFFAWLYSALTVLVARYAPFLQMNLLYQMSPPMQMVAMILTSDFVGYWNHRWRHASRYAWAFHTVHHSQKTLTVATTFRFHFLDETFLRLWLFIPFQLLGTTITTWLTLDFIMAWLLAVQHSEWDWSYGWLGRVFVSPVFHRKHHSTEARLQNKNFSMLFSFWDDLFGTADRVSPAPTIYGLADNRVDETLYGQIVYPFVLFRRTISEASGRRHAPLAAATETGNVPGNATPPNPPGPP
jgi:sterol desaturase/sphingolipid hydroxylase (fatty acid hydroxylase superfamily)